MFIQNTSKLAKVNLIPFFEKWGVSSDIHTILALSSLPELKLPIWENDNNHVHTISLPEGKYIPELFHLKRCINNISLEKKTLKFSMDLEWYNKYQFMFFVNDQYIAEVTNGKPYYCYLNVDGDGAHVTYQFNEHTDLKELLESDLFNVRVSLKDKHIIYKTTVLTNSLMQDVRELYTDDELSIIRDDIDQSLLDELWDKYNNLDETDISEKILDKLREVQRSVLTKTIKKHTIIDKKSSVIFKDESYKYYEFVTVMNGAEVAKLQYGNALPPSTVNNNIWSTPIPVISPEYIYIYVNVKGFRYAIKKTYIKEIDILDKINALYSDIEQEILIEGLTQSDIDLCNDSVWNSGLPYWKKDVLERKVDKVQSLFIKNTITSTYIINNTYVVEFNEKRTFIDYRYFLYSSEGYISEISYGKAYYSSLNGLKWKTAINNTIKPESIYIKAYHNKWLDIHTESDSAKWIKTQLK